MRSQNRSTFAMFLSDALLLAGCCFLAVSIVQPFASFEKAVRDPYSRMDFINFSVTHWSFKIEAVEDHFHEEHTFFDYWSGDYWFNWDLESPNIMMLFLVQILTLLTGLISLLLKSKMMRIVPTIFSSIVFYLIYRFSAVDQFLFSTHVVYGPGFTLTLTSLIVFISALALGIRRKGELKT